MSATNICSNFGGKWCSLHISTVLQSLSVPVWVIMCLENFGTAD